MSAKRAEDVMVEASGQMHSHAFDGLSDAEAGERVGRARRTANNWRRGQKGSIPHDFISYVTSSPNPAAVEAEVAAVRKTRILDGESTEDLIHRYWELKALEKEIEGEDNALDVQPPTSWEWMRKAQMKKRDAAVETELAAIYTQFAMRGVKVETVLEGAGR